MTDTLGEISGSPTLACSNDPVWSISDILGHAFPIAVAFAEHYSRNSAASEYAHTRNEGTAVRVLPREMPADYFVRDGKKPAAGALGGLDPGLVAETPGPFVGAGRLVAGLPGPAALETPGIHIVSPTKERAEEGDLGCG